MLLHFNALVVTVGVFLTGGAIALGVQTATKPTAAPYTEHAIITCGTTATAIDTDSGAAHFGGFCTNDSTTAVFTGDSTVTTSDYGGEWCNDAACVLAYWSPAQSEYCIVANGTQDIHCRFAVPMEP